MERSPGEVRAHQVAAAAAHDLNDDLTILQSQIDLLLAGLPVGDPNCPGLMDLKAAGGRCKLTTELLLNHSLANGATPSSLTLAKMIEQILESKCNAL